jgi:hypothetical protein
VGAVDDADDPQFGISHPASRNGTVLVAVSERGQPAAHTHPV